MTELVSLRPAVKEDTEFQLRVYASTRQEELAVTTWTDQQKETFLRHQFEAQTHYYADQYADASFDIILVRGSEAGRLIVRRSETAIRIVDIALLPEFRSHGTGSQLILELQREASCGGKTLEIHVEKFNPALNLYQRLGFRATDDRGVYWFMTWDPQQAGETGRQPKTAS